MNESFQNLAIEKLNNFAIEDLSGRKGNRSIA
jgi:hypothetical protein